MALLEHISAVRGKYKEANKFLSKTIDRLSEKPSAGGATGISGEVISMMQKMQPKNLLRPLKINFKGEGAQDEGGCKNEMFSQFFDAVFSPKSLYFERQQGNAEAKGSGAGAGGMDCYLPKVDANLDALRSIGKLMMKSLLEDDICLPHCLPPSFFDFLTDPTCSVPSDTHQALNALSYFDEQKAKGLTNLLLKEQYVGMAVGDMFDTDADCEDGESEDAPLTAGNIGGCIRRYVGHVLVRSRRVQLDALRDGFLTAVPGLAKHLELFHGIELMQILCGVAHIDAEAVLGSISFDGVGGVSSVVGGYLQRFVREANNDTGTLKKIISFATGISVIPNQGLRMKIRVKRGSASLWVSHTCFYELELPECSSYEEFAQKATCSLENGAVGFGQK